MSNRPVLNGRNSVKLAVVQRSPAFMDKATTITRTIAAITEAGAAGADLVAFPEVWLAGYPYWTEGWDSLIPQWAPAAIIFHDNAITVPGPETVQLSAAIKMAGVNAVIGVNELDSRPGSQTIYNTLLFFGRDGTLLGRHRKLMPTFSERPFWGSGDGSDFVAFDMDCGRVSGLICGEHQMTLVRGATIAHGEEIHVAVFPGSFSLSAGPQLQEPDRTGVFFGQHAVLQHAFEANAFVASAVGILDPADVPPTFPYAGKMNIDYAIGGSSIVSPLGELLVGPIYDHQTIIYADCPAALIKARAAIADTIGHYARPDCVRVQIRTRTGDWTTLPFETTEIFDTAMAAGRLAVSAFGRAADAHGVDRGFVAEVACKQADVANSLMTAIKQGK